jgi:hypothetical protein
VFKCAGILHEGVVEPPTPAKKYITPADRQKKDHRSIGEAEERSPAKMRK